MGWLDSFHKEGRLELIKNSYVGCRLGQILHVRLRMNCSALNAHLFIRNLVESPNCICGITETVSHFLLDCPRHTTLRQQLLFSLLDIPETISLNLLMFGAVNLNDEENKAVFKSVQTFIIIRRVWKYQRGNQNM